MAEQFGYNVGNTLESILTQQRNDKRQAMIDDINRQNIQSEIGARNEQADAARVYKESIAAKNAQDLQDRKDNSARRQRFGDALKGISAQTVPPPNPLTGPIDPNDTTGDQTGASQAPVPLIGQTAPGTAQALQLLQALGPDDPKSDTLLQTIISGMSKPKTGTTRTGGYIWTSDRNGNPVNTGQWMEGVNGDQYHEKPAPQQPSAANVKQLYYIDEPSPTNPKQMVKVAHWLYPGEQPSPQNVMKNAPPAGVHRGNLSGKPIALYDQKVLNGFQNSLRTAGSLHEQLTKVNGFIATISDPDVKKDVGDIINDPDLQGVPFEELVMPNPTTGQPVLAGEPEHLAKVREVLRLVRPGLDKAQ